MYSETPEFNGNLKFDSIDWSFSAYKNKKLKFSNRNKLFQTNTTKYDFFIFIFKKGCRIILP